MAKSKYYVVWKGLNPGVYDSWAACRMQVEGQEGAKYKSFATQEEADEAFEKGYGSYLKPAPDFASSAASRLQEGTFSATTSSTSSQERSAQTIRLSAGTASVGKPIPESLAVDAACSGNPGDMEYRGVYTATGQEIFHIGPFPQGTNNIGEFLALVHGLALLQQKGSPLPIYSDSRNAILWVKKKKCKTLLERTPVNQPIFDLIERAEKWLNTHTYTTPILKWETSVWGEIPADFGRK